MLEPEPPRPRRRAARRPKRRAPKALAGGGPVLLLALVAAAVIVAVNGSRKDKPRAARRLHASVVPQAALAHPRLPLEAQGDAVIRRLARLGLPVFCGGPRGHALALTFDDGPGPYTHYAVTKLLKAHERATFFVVGRSVGFFPGWLPRELRVAAIGDHTSTHPLLPSLSPAAIATEIDATKRQIQAQTGQPVYLFRPPYGALNQTVLQTAAHLGLLPILWTADSRDSLGANWAAIIRNVEAALRPGAIILMHENRGQTIRALTTLLPVIHRRHLHSVSLPELFATDPPSVAQVRHGAGGCRGPAQVTRAAG